MLAQLIRLEFTRVRIHGVKSRKLQRHIHYNARRLRHSRRRPRISDRIETLVTNIGDDVYVVVECVNFLLGSDLNLPRRATHKIAQHLAPECFVSVVLRIHFHLPTPRVRCRKREGLSATVPLLDQQRRDLGRTFNAARFQQD